LSPILVRPVREQLEHDRIIRLLHAKFRRRYETAMNPGNEQNAAVGTGPSALYPDLLLMAPERGHKLQVIIEIETGESVNHLEALAQWAHFARTRAAFHLYVPAGMVDVARRLCEDNHIYVSEIWSYHVVGDQPRFTLVHRNREAPPPLPKPKPAPKPVVAPKPVAAPKSAAPKPTRAATKKPAAKPAPKPKAKPKKAVKSKKR
jgi:cell division septation protein DedD